jgi:hypothetical protein
LDTDSVPKVGIESNFTASASVYHRMQGAISINVNTGKD